MAFPASLVLLLLLDSWPVSAGRAFVDRHHTYDVLAYDVDAEPTAKGLVVDCRLRLRVARGGPLSFLLSVGVEDLSVTLRDAEVPFTHGAGGLDTLLGLAGVPAGNLPGLLALEPRTPLAAGEEATFRLRYRWRPAPGGWYRAGARDVETHLSSFWLPTMADEIFETTLRVRTDAAAFGPGAARRTADGWLFEGEAEQVVPLFVADLVRVEGKGCEVWLPAEMRAEGEGIARDLEATLRVLEGWFGPAGGGPFRLVVAPQPRVASYCAGSFAVVKSRPSDRDLWIQHLAHECAHRWFGHRLATPVIGDGGTWLREGLAEWAGIEAAGEILGADRARVLWRERFARYVSRSDLRRGAGNVLFANETTLLDATYLDDPHVPYFRGALVLRLVARETGAPDFRARLRGLMEGKPTRILDAAEVLRATGGGGIAAYYAGTTRLPDLRLEEVAIGATGATARVVCDDPLWPGGRVPVRVDRAGGSEVVEVEVRGGGGALRFEGEGVRGLEVDPERLFLDPVRSNGVR